MILQLLLLQDSHWLPSTAPGPDAKWLYSTEALDEIHGLQRYVAALAQNDLASGSATFASAALGQNTSSTADVISFMFHQQHAHELTPVEPLPWGDLLLIRPTRTRFPSLLSWHLRGGARKRPAAAAATLQAVGDNATATLHDNATVRSCCGTKRR